MRNLRDLYGIRKSIPVGLLTLIVLLVGPVWAATYYVDATGGNDANVGTSPTSALKTLAAVEQKSFSPGDVILFKRGEVWVGKFTLNSSGTAEAPIRIGAYGSGAPPRITYTVPVTEWTALGDGLYKYDTDGKWCYGLFEDGNKLKQAGSATLEDGNWYFDGDAHILYYKPTSGEASAHECAFAPSYYLLRIRGQNYIEIEDLDLQYAGGGMVIRDGASHITIRNCSLSYFYEQALNFYSSGESCTVTGCTISHCGDGVYFMNAPGDHNVVSGNTITHCNYGEFNNNDGHAIGIQNSSNNIIENNVIQFCKDAIALWSSSGNQVSNNIIRYNKISDCNKTYASSNLGKGIIIAGDADNGATGNQVYYNIISYCNYGIKVKRSNVPSNSFFNNVIRDCNVGIWMASYCDHTVFKNNIIYNSRDYHIYSEHTSNGTDNIFDYNAYYPDGSKFMDRGNSLTGFEEWRSRTQQDAHSIVGDPKMEGNGSCLLLTDSPCIDHGADVGLDKDISGNPVPSGNGVDIGAVEYVATESPPSPPSNLKVITE